MSDAYLHGAYGQTQAAGNRVAAKCQNVMVLVGTAPVHTVFGGAENVNKPILVHDIAEARRYFGYSESWEDYTLCEAMRMFLEHKAVGPLVLINVLDPNKHKGDDAGKTTLTPKNGRMTIDSAENIVLDSVKVGSYVLNTDYVIAYNHAKKTITITETVMGGLGTEAIEITYATVDPSAVTENDVIGSSDGNGLNTGLYAMKNVYQITGYIPSFLLAPGFSSIPAVHAAMYANSVKINNHWDAWMFTDLPLVDSDGTALTLDSVHTWRKANGYDKENETVCFPMIQGTDGKLYHMSVVRAANFAQLLLENEGIPYHTASNTEAPIIKNLWMGETAASAKLQVEQLPDMATDIWGEVSADGGTTWERWEEFHVREGDESTACVFYLPDDTPRHFRIRASFISRNYRQYWASDSFLLPEEDGDDGGGNRGGSITPVAPEREPEEPDPSPVPEPEPEPQEPEPTPEPEQEEPEPEPTPEPKPDDPVSASGALPDQPTENTGLTPFSQAVLAAAGVSASAAAGIAVAHKGIFRKKKK